MDRATQRNILFVLFGVVIVVVLFWFVKLFRDTKNARETYDAVVASANTPASNISTSPSPVLSITPAPTAVLTDQDNAKQSAQQWLDARFGALDSNGFRCAYSKHENGNGFIIMLKDPVVTVTGGTTSEATQLNSKVTWSGTVEITSMTYRYYSIFMQGASGFGDPARPVEDQTEYEDNFLRRGTIKKVNGTWKISDFEAIEVPVNDKGGISYASRTSGSPDQFKPVDCGNAPAFLRQNRPSLPKAKPPAARNDQSGRLNDTDDEDLGSYEASNDRDEVEVKICSITGSKATPKCPNKFSKFFKKGREPKGFCSLHAQPVANANKGSVKPF